MAGTWRLHGTLEGDARPLLCKDPETANLIVDVLGRAIQARAAGDADKAKRLFELAAKLEGEIWLRTAPETSSSCVAISATRALMVAHIIVTTVGMMTVKQRPAIPRKIYADMPV